MRKFISSFGAFSVKAFTNRDFVGVRIWLAPPPPDPPYRHLAPRSLTHHQATVAAMPWPRPTARASTCRIPPASLGSEASPKSPPLSRKQRDLWDRLSKFIRQEGGWIVGQQHFSPIRFEAPLDSELSVLLQRAGHRVKFIGTHERLMSVVETMKNTVATIPFRVSRLRRRGRVWQLELPPVHRAEGSGRGLS